MIFSLDVLIETWRPKHTFGIFCAPYSAQDFDPFYLGYGDKLIRDYVTWSREAFIPFEWFSEYDLSIKGS